MVNWLKNLVPQAELKQFRSHNYILVSENEALKHQSYSDANRLAQLQQNFDELLSNFNSTDRALIQCRKQNLHLEDEILHLCSALSKAQILIDKSKSKKQSKRRKKK